MMNNNYRSTTNSREKTSNSSSEGFCQKCFTEGHWTYQCKGEKAPSTTYTKRLSHTEKLEMMRKGIPINEQFDLPPEAAAKKQQDEDDDAIWTCSDSDSYLNPDYKSSSGDSSYSSSSSDGVGSMSKRLKKLKKKRKTNSSSSSDSSSDSEQDIVKETKVENTVLDEYKRRLKEEIEKHEGKSLETTKQKEESGKPSSSTGANQQKGGSSTTTTSKSQSESVAPRGGVLMAAEKFSQAKRNNYNDSRRGGFNYDNNNNRRRDFDRRDDRRDDRNDRPRDQYERRGDRRDDRRLNDSRKSPSYDSRSDSRRSPSYDRSDKGDSYYGRKRDYDEYRGKSGGTTSGENDKQPESKSQGSAPPPRSGNKYGRVGDKK